MPCNETLKIHHGLEGNYCATVEDLGHSLYLLQNSIRLPRPKNKMLHRLKN